MSVWISLTIACIMI